MTLPLWPAVVPQANYRWHPIRRVKKGGPFGGDRWLKRADNRFELMQIGPLTYVSEDPEEIRPLYDFWNSVGGPLGVFDFADLNMWDGGWLTWANVFSGQIAASTLDYDLPIATSTGTGFSLKLDGVSKTVQRITTPGSEDGSSDVYLYPGAGANGRDRAHTRVQQTVGAIITETGKGQRFATVQVLEEEPPIEWEPLTIYTFGPVTFLEVR
jgi:hypothetical protein